MLRARDTALRSRSQHIDVIDVTILAVDGMLPGVLNGLSLVHAFALNMCKQFLVHLHLAVHRDGKARDAPTRTLHESEGDLRLAVFTSKYPARVTTFFERDMRALLEAGIDLEVFAIYPLDASQWPYTLDTLSGERMLRDRVHHLGLGKALRRARNTLRRHGTKCLRDAGAVLSAAAHFGPGPLAKTAYVLPKAWAWAAKHCDRFDHVLAYWGNYAGTCAYIFHRLLERPIPFSIWVHAGTDLYKRPVFLQQKLRYADNILTCCEFNREYMRRRFRDLSSMIGPKIHVSHHGLNLPEFPFRSDGRRTRRVIAVGGLVKDKGFDYLLRAAQQLAARGVDLTIEVVGDGTELRALRALARNLGIVKRVVFRGWLPFPEVCRAISQAAVLVHPSARLGDGLPNVVREAMALGTPVVASSIAGIPDALKDGCGILVPARDVAALANAIKALLDNPTARWSIAHHARRRVEERYDMWQNGTRLAEILCATRRTAGRAEPFSRGRTTSWSAI